MSDKATKHMISAYFQDAEPTMFLSGLFEARPENFHNSETVEIDIVRSEEDVAIVVQDLSTGYRYNEDEKYTNKEFKPPIFKEAYGLNAFDLIKRMPGQNPFEDPNFQANATVEAFRKFRLLERKIRRSLELQASQVLQTGIITLVDSAGTALYSLDYKPKSSHFPTSGTTWGQVGADPLGDILSLGREVREDGLARPDQLIFGEKALIEFLKDANVQALYNNRRIDQGAITRMERRSNGGTYHGTIEIGAYDYEIWTYDGMFKHPQTGVKTDFVHTGKVIVRSSKGRMDKSFGGVPRIAPPDSRVLPFLPRLSSREAGMDMWTNAWLTADGEQLMAGVASRPLIIPTAIDTYGCLNTGLS